MSELTHEEIEELKKEQEEENRLLKEMRKNAEHEESDDEEESEGHEEHSGEKEKAPVLKEENSHPESEKPEPITSHTVVLTQEETAQKREHVMKQIINQESQKPSIILDLLKLTDVKLTQDTQDYFTRLYNLYQRSILTEQEFTNKLTFMLGKKSKVK